jgi:hypothetical protein
MASYDNQHWVPQYYFRQFSGGKPYINALLKRQEKIVRKCPIRGQCSASHFYGDAELEKALGEIENEDAAALRNILRFTSGRSTILAQVDEDQLYRACLFQWGRTSYQASKTADFLRTFKMRAFRHYIECAPNIDNRLKLLEAIDAGHMELKGLLKYGLMLSMDASFDSVPYIMDLELRFLINKTELPFVFGDAPVVLLNPYLKEITSRGVLGLTTPGLLISWPLDSQTSVLLIDKHRYRGPVLDQKCYCVIRKSDVSQLNALQVRHSDQAIFFECSQHASYVETLWGAHGTRGAAPHVELKESVDWSLDGNPVEAPILQFIETGSNYSLELSELRPIANPTEPYAFSRRDPQFFVEVEEMIVRSKRERGTFGAH